MFYIHQTRCISAQETFPVLEMGMLHASINNKLTVIEPPYTGVAANTLRRMGKAGRIGIGSAMPLLQEVAQIDGMIIGTANGGMEESIRFLKQIIEYNEDMLAPGSFVQSTANAIASQLGMYMHNHGYNITHVHKGLAFENAMIDAAMAIAENPSHTYLLGGVDEIASYNYQVEYAAGWYKKEIISNNDLYNSNTPGSIAGEGAAMFVVSGQEENAIARVAAIKVLHTGDINEVADQLKEMLATKLPPGQTIDLFLTGENGDSRYEKLFEELEEQIGAETTVARFKHLCGEYPTASAFALWLACSLPSTLPEHMIKRKGNRKDIKNIILYNQYQGVQHSLIVLTKL